MSAINGVGANNPIQKVVSQPIHKQLPTDAVKQMKLTDRVQLSHVNHLLQTLKAGGDIRADKVASMREQIQAGGFETEARLDGAITRLMDDLER